MNQQDVASHQYAENIGSRLARTNRQEIVRQHEVEESSRGSARSSLAEQVSSTRLGHPFEHFIPDGSFLALIGEFEFSHLCP